MGHIAYIGRSNNIHDKRIVKALSHYFKVSEIYTIDLESEFISREQLSACSLIVAGPLTDAISVIPKPLNIPILGISHAFDLNTESNDPAIAANIERCAAIISDCGYIANLIRNNYQYSGPIFQIPIGCDRKYFSKAKIEFEKRIKIIVTRNWYPIYRNDVIVEALKILYLKSIDFRCVFIGDGPLLEEGKKSLADFSKSIDIEFLGHQSRTQIRDQMADNWIYISASSSDGSSISLLEAMATGMICITSDFPSNSEWIKNSISGFQFPDGDSKALAALIESITTLSDEEKKGIGLNAKETIRQHGDWIENQKTLVTVVNSMIQRK